MNPVIKSMPQSFILIARIPHERQPGGHFVFQKAFNDIKESPFTKPNQEPQLPEQGKTIRDFQLYKDYSVSFLADKVTLVGKCVQIEMANLLVKKGDVLVPELNPSALFTIFTESEWRCPEIH